MSGSISPTSYDYASAMDNIRSEVESYCATNGIDTDEFLANLDEKLTTSVFDNPTLQAYFQLAYMQLVELLYPEKINSLEAEVGEVNFETLYTNSDDAFNSFITNLIEDDPELMAFYARQAGGASEGDFVLGMLASMAEQQNSENGGNGQNQQNTSITQDARDLTAKYDLGPGFDWVINKEDAFAAAETAILDRLSEYDQAVNEMVDMLANGEGSDAELQNLQYVREGMIAMLQHVTDAKLTFMETISKIYKDVFEMQNALINNWRAF